MAQLTQLGGKAAADCREVGANAEAVFVMVLNGAQVKDVVLGAHGLLEGLQPDSTVIVSGTIHPADVKVLEAPAAKGLT